MFFSLFIFTKFEIYLWNNLADELLHFSLLYLLL